MFLRNELIFWGNIKKSSQRQHTEKKCIKVMVQKLSQQQGERVFFHDAVWDA